MKSLLQLLSICELSLWPSDKSLLNYLLDELFSACSSQNYTVVGEVLELCLWQLMLGGEAQPLLDSLRAF